MLPGESQTLMKPKRRVSELKRAASFDDQYMRSCYHKAKVMEKRRNGSFMTRSAGQMSVRSSSPSNFTSDLDERMKKLFDDVKVPDRTRLVYIHSDLLGEPASPEADTKAHVVSYDQENGLLSGLLYFSLCYDPMVTELVITIKRATDLPTYEDQSVLNPYINFCLVPEDFYWQQTTVAEATTNPIFNKVFHIPDVLHHKLRQYSICFLVMDSTKTNGDRVIWQSYGPSF